MKIASLCIACLVVGFVFGFSFNKVQNSSEPTLAPVLQSIMPVVEVEELSTVIAKWAEDIREHNGAKSKTSWDYTQEDGSSNGKHVCHEYEIPDPDGGIAMTLYAVIEFRPPIRVMRGDLVEIDCVVHSIDQVSKESVKSDIIGKARVIEQ